MDISTRLRNLSLCTDLKTMVFQKFLPPNALLVSHDLNHRIKTTGQDHPAPVAKHLNRIPETLADQSLRRCTSR